jgi:peptidoglycan/LPS O-acetylase OafA/YrhL
VAVPAPNAPGGPRPGRRLLALDGLRLFAALSVLAYHFTARDSDAWGTHPWNIWPEVSKVTQYGKLGVQLFFVISGFVILMSAWGRRPDQFVSSRVTRLFPAYWAGVLATGFLLTVLWPAKQLAPWQVVANLTMVQSALGIGHVDGVYWTLWAELRFYVLVGLLAVAGLTRRRVMTLVLLWPPLAVWAHNTDQDLIAGLLNYSTAPFFCLGMVLYLTYRDGATILHWLLLAYAWALSIGLVGVRFPDGAVEDTGRTPSLVVELVLITLAVVAVAVCARLRLDHPRWRWLVAAGALTYPLYLLHEYWGWYFIHLLHPVLPAYPTLVLAAALSLLAAWLVHRLVERPAAPVLKRLLDRAFEQVRRDDAAEADSAGAAAYARQR